MPYRIDFHLQEDISVILDQNGKDRMVILQQEGQGRDQSLRRRKNGAVARPKMIDFVGQPKHKNSVLNDCLLDLPNGLQTTKDNFDELIITEKISSTKSLERSHSCPLGESCLDRDHESEVSDFSKDYVELTTLIDNLLLEETKIASETKIALQRSLKSKVTDSEDKSVEPKSSLTRTEEKTRVNRVRISNNNETRYSARDRQKGTSLNESMRNSRNVRLVARSRSLPMSSESKSKLPAFIQALRHKNQKIINSANQSSDGEGSAQSMMSFESTSSSRSKRSGSILSRLSRTSSSSTMYDKRSRSGSLTTNRTGCPQYFIPGENRGRMYLMPAIDLYGTSSLCIKGIRFKIRRNMPRTHRAVSMIGCMGFVVPAPSKYFEK